MVCIILCVTAPKGHVLLCGEKFSPKGMHAVCSKTKPESEEQQVIEVSVKCLEKMCMVFELGDLHY